MPSATRTDDTMEVVASEQVWKEVDDDDLVFDHVRVILRQGSRHFFARQQDQYAAIDPTMLQLEEIPDTFLHQLIPPDMTHAPDPPPPNSYIKKPNLLDYGDTSNCNEILLQEAKVYELLLQHPHPNIAQYHGCVVENGWFRGICLQRYPATIKQHVERHCRDPGEPAFSETEKRRLVQGIRAGAAHLHGLGLVHNDLNPSNIMVDEDTNAIIIDFDSCRPIGEPMGMKGSQPGWGTYTEYAELESDVQNLDLIERYLMS